MTIDASTVSVLVGVLTALVTLGGVAIAVIKWVCAQNRQTEEIAALRERHEKDMQETSERERAEIQAIRDELCVLSYAMLASLDGLKQLHCNGEVTKAHEKLEKHLNQQAHGQNRGNK